MFRRLRTGSDRIDNSRVPGKQSGDSKSGEIFEDGMRDDVRCMMCTIYDLPAGRQVYEV